MTTKYKLATTLVLGVAMMSSALAQQAPNPNPPVGGLANPGELLSGSNARQARREIARDTIERQYTPAEILEYRKVIEAYERSKAGVYQEAARVVRRRISVGVSPDSPVEEIRLNAENVGAMVFTDALGQPWKVADVLAPKTFVKHTISNNMVIFEPAERKVEQGGEARFGRGSVTILLEGLNSTIPFALSFGLSREVDGQIEAQVQARNPTAPINMVRADMIERDDVADLFLDGEPPKGAVTIKTSSKAVESWLYNGKLYVRTSLGMHSPAFKNFGASASGLNIYTFDRVPSVVNALVDGAVVSVSIGD